MWTGLKENTEYSAQITPYHGYVMAEIIAAEKNKEKGFNEHSKYDSGLWLTVLDKRFGSWFRKTPTEQNWKDANKWVETQLDLIEKYGTVVVTKPQYLRDSEALTDKS